MFSLSSKKALITGGSGAIGSAIAKAFIEQGADVVISGTNNTILSSISEKIGAKKILCNLANQEETLSLINQATTILGGLDILVNNAGINKDMLFMKMSIEDFEQVMRINLKATFLLTQQAVKIMAPQRFGRIINISSVVAFTGNIGQANYCASKAAIVGFSKSVALEYAKRGITVNCIAPGAIQSKMIEELSPNNLEKFLAKIPVGKIGTPEDVAYTCCFLASQEANYITGQTFHVNGGMF